ncbi:MAG: tetratricopeptide repeat protein [Alphaproteobacteria bacterium]|nr:tetratricopeptide repeat protein [Alphaproteobacteria bacterium]
MNLFLLTLAMAGMPLATWAQPAALPAGTNPQVEAMLQQSYQLERTKPAEAEAGYKAAVAVAEKITDPRERAELPRALIWQTFFYRNQKRYPEAWAVAERSLREHKERLGLSDPRTDKAHAVLGTVAYMSGQYTKAEPLYRIALDGYARDPSDARALEAGTAALNLANTLRALSRLPEAEEAQRKGIEIRERTVPRDVKGIALEYRQLGVLRAELKRFTEAARAYEAAVKTAENLQGPQLATLAIVLASQAAFLRSQKDYVGARISAERVLALPESALGKDHPSKVKIRAELARIAVDQKDQPGAEAHFSAVLEGYSRNPHVDSALAASQASHYLAASFRVQKRFADAEKMIRGSIAVREAVTPNDRTGLAAAYQLLALVCSDQRKIAEAEPAFRKAIALYGATAGPEAVEVGNLYLWLADAYFAVGRYQDAAGPNFIAVTILSKWPDTLALATAQVRFSVTYRYLRRFDEAQSLARRALAAREAMLPPGDPMIADALLNLAAALRWQGRFAEAEPLYRRSLAIREEALGGNDALVFADVNGLGLSLDGLGRSVEAEALFRRALIGREIAKGEEHEDVADTLVSLVWNLRRQGRLAEAAEIAERPLNIYRKRLGPDHPDVVRGLVPLAVMRQERGEFEEADRLFRDALRVRTLAYGANHIAVADSYGDLVGLSIARRQFEEAAGYSSRRLKIYEAAFGTDDPRIIGALSDVQSLQAFNGDMEAVEALAKRILGIVERAYGAESIAVATASMNVAYAYRLQGKFGNAESYYERPLAIYRKKLGPKHPSIAGALGLVAELRMALGQTQEAETLYDESIALLAAAYGEDSPAIGGMLNDKALLLLQLKRLDEAEKLMKRAVELLRKGAGKSTSDLAAVLVNLSHVQAGLGRRGEAEKLLREAVAIYTSLYGPNRLPPLVPGAIVPPKAREM